MTLPAPIRGLRAAFVFLTRLPLGGFPYRDRDFAWAPAHAPIVGVVVGAAGGAVFAGALGAGPLAAALCAIAVTVLVTGGFHEDGLADTADALGGAIFDRERVLSILKDSRVGTYGALALVLSVALRAALIAELATRGGPELGVAATGAALFVVSHAAARVAPTWLMASMPYVTDAAHARSRPVVRAGAAQAIVATLEGLAVVGAFVAFAPSFGSAVWIACAAVAASALACAWRFRRRVGGITGDFLGATEQVGEAAFLLALACAT